MRQDHIIPGMGDTADANVKEDVVELHTEQLQCFLTKRQDVVVQ